MGVCVQGMMDKVLGIMAEMALPVTYCVPSTPQTSHI
jgi:hypothetical protein